VQQAVRQALKLTRANLEEARRSVLDLRAAPLEGHTLAQALAKLAKEWTTSGGSAITFTATGGSRPLPVRVEVGVYRMVQEALTNSLSHAQARHIAITLLTTPNELTCAIADDGHGFEPAQAPAGHFGLVGLNERAKLLGGKIHLKSAPGHGTHIAITIPLEAAQ
jgi:two-component system NarL family sensor kinase